LTGRAKGKASPEEPEMPKYKVNQLEAKEIKNAKYIDDM